MTSTRSHPEAASAATRRALLDRMGELKPALERRLRLRLPEDLRTDLQSVTMHRQKIVISRIAHLDWCLRRERRAHAPGVVIEPGPRVGRSGRDKPVEIADRALGADRRRMMAADGREAAVRQAH